MIDIVYLSAAIAEFAKPAPMHRDFGEHIHVGSCWSCDQTVWAIEKRDANRKQLLAYLRDNSAEIIEVLRKGAQA